jgi:hypothetical protein
MTSGSIIDYEALTQEAMRGLVRTVLTRVAKFGLPGDHHFYISFDTEAAAVGMSKRLRERYPHEMTIVLQHRFWDLAVFDDRFEVKLTFDSIPERLVIPFAAIKVFFDPSVRYGVQFEEAEGSGETGAPAEEPETGPASRTPRPVSGAARKPRAPRRAKPDKETATPVVPSAPVAVAPPRPEVTPIGIPHAAHSKPADGAHVSHGETAETADKSAGNGAQILSLDAFRKK